MEKKRADLTIGYTDEEINKILKQEYSEPAPYSKHFDQNEDFFITINQELTIPQFPIHHDVRSMVPNKNYLHNLRSIITDIFKAAPNVLKNLTYFFDSAEILKPSFFHIYKIKDKHYLFLLRLDFTFRSTIGTVIQRGTNDTTPEYKTNRLYMEALFIPLEDILYKEGRISGFIIDKMISQTWIGETGRGYFVQGIWIDNELSKFFSKLFIPNGRRSYPFYPYVCKHRTICLTVIKLEPEERRKALPYLHQVLKYLGPELPYIQEAIKGDSFSQDMPVFHEMKQKIPSNLSGLWQNLSVESYLNEEDHKEYQVDY